MNRYTNPFHTLEDVVATLESLGTNPLNKDQFISNWASKILSITVDKKYMEDCTPYYETQIHVNLQGFKEFVNVLEGAYVFGREHLETSNAYDRVELELSDTLTIVTLVNPEEELEWLQ